MIRTILTSVRHENLNLTLRSGTDHVVRILERPATSMSDAELAVLTAQLRQIAGQVLGQGELTYGVFSGRAEAFEDKIITLVTTAEGEPVAFSAMTLMQVETRPEPTEVLHLGLVMIVPQARSAGLSWVLYGLTCFLLAVRQQLRPIWISNVTQVPAVLGMVSGMLSEVWPAPGAPRRKLIHILLARQIMRHHRSVFGVGADAGFDEARFVITGAYTGGSDDLKKTWAEAPKYRDPHVNAICAEQLDYDRGDDFLQLGQMDLAAVRRYLSREVPRGALWSVVLSGGLVALQRLILPVLHWFDTTQPFSILRPEGRE